MKKQDTLKCIRALVRDECPYWHEDNCKKRGTRCPLTCSDDRAVPDNTVDCREFQEHFLPADWDLNDLILYAEWCGRDR